MKVPLIDLKAQYNSIRDEIRQALDRVVEKQQFILGDEVAGLEEETRRYCKTGHAIGCASGTDAILLSLLALDIQPGDEVITTSFSFFSTAGMISWLNAKPVFVDIDPGTFNLDPDLVAAKINSRTRAIIAVHLFGQCSNMEKLNGLGVPVIEDACQAIGASRDGHPAGSMGKTGCFSFFPTKNLGAFGDGGMITTQDADLAALLQQVRVHGQSTQRYLHHRIGTNSRLDELQAAILRAKFKHLNDWNAQRGAHADFYRKAFQGLPIQLPVIDPKNTHTNHQFVIQTDKRDALKQFLSDHGIGSAIYYPLPLPLQPCFAELGYKAGDFPNAEKCAARCLALPVYPEMTQEQQEYVADSIRTFFQ